MPVRLTEEQIARLLRERKPLPANFGSRVQLRPKRGHRERELDINGEDGGQFRLIFRQSEFNVLDFSVILAYRLPNSTEVFRLRRHNGRSHEHTNPIERVTFYDFHIHQATERYQEIGAPEDMFAEPTDRFGDFDQATECLLADCGFAIPPNQNPRLF